MRDLIISLLIIASILVFFYLKIYKNEDRSKISAITKNIDYSIRYSNGQMFCKQVGEMKISGKDTSIKRYGDIEIYYPNGLLWQKRMTNDDYNDSIVTFSENGVIETVCWSDLDSTSTTFYKDGKIKYSISYLPDSKSIEEISDYSYAGVIKKKEILEDGFPFSFIAYDSIGNVLLNCEYDYITQLMKIDKNTKQKKVIKYYDSLEEQRDYFR